MKSSRRPDHLGKRPSSRFVWIAAQLALGAVGFAVFALNGDVPFGAAVFAIMIASVLAFEIADRRGLSIAGLLTGIGDERVRGLYREANARTSEIMSYVFGIWAVFVVAEGQRNDTLMIVVIAYSALWIFNIVRVGLSGRGAAEEQAANRSV